MNWQVWICGVSVCGVLALPSSAQPAAMRAQDAYNRGDYATAVREWKWLATRDHELAQYNLGVMYAQGVGVAQDDAEAARWFREAAQRGHARAQYNLGSMYFNGNGVAKDYVQAHMWLSLA
ncbi:MAG: tetratricopeptide repeat protein, partial [Bryobacteraceae bacterium]